ncbi:MULTISPECIES: MlaD family protein [unclassified Nocardia]|uniref:MlaD family protein n=1 Tax=unclassified Nocardia TaxID=2637762 RepID=UPI001CE3D986|nr:MULTISPECIES: MlaD family protein [unclassified Nocardia]
MQRLNRETTQRRRELRFGVACVIAIAVLLVATGAFYVFPPGKTTYTAELSDAESVKTGDQVRIAGVPVGTVTSLRLRPDTVRMTFTVDRGVFIGDQTTLQIRLLTIVGGHYVAAFPSGMKPLGSTPIPADRVQLPYSLVRAMQDATAPIAEVDGETLRKTFDALQTALAGSPDALRRIGDATKSIVDILDKQNAEVSRALAVTDEYLTTVDVNRSKLGEFVRRLGKLESVALAKRDEVLTAVDVTAQLLARIAALEPSWHDVLQPLADKLAEAIPALQRLGAKLDAALRAIHDMSDRLRQLIAPGTAPPPDPAGASPLCIPLPGQRC